jgi:predicted nicotinamide N-methyase
VVKAVNGAIPSMVAGFPVRPIAFQFDSLRLPLLVIQHLEEYVDAEALLRDPHAPEPPYWAHVWPGSQCLARIMARAACAGRRVVDIGCGLGLAGIVAGVRGAAVTLIDTARDGLQFARANADLNGVLPDRLCTGERSAEQGSVAIIQSDICSPGLRGRFEYVLAADVTYDPALQSAVALFLAEHLAVTGQAWCAESVRTFDQGFRLTCEAYGLLVTESEVSELDEQREVRVRLTEVRWP